MKFGKWTVKTSYDYPPIPDRSMDWSAWIDGQEEHSAWYGHGQTELEALLDLHQHLVEDGELPQIKWVKEWEAPLEKAREHVANLQNALNLVIDRTCQCDDCKPWRESLKEAI